MVTFLCIILLSVVSRQTYVPAAARMGRYLSSCTLTIFEIPFPVNRMA